MVPKGPSALPGGHFAPHGLAQRSSERCSIISRLRSQLAFATPLNAVSLPDRRISAKRQKGVLAFAVFFSLGSFAHSSAHFRQASPQRENASIWACLSQALASSSQARAQTTQSGYAYFEPRSRSWVVRARSARSRALSRSLRRLRSHRAGRDRRLLSAHSAGVPCYMLLCNR